MTKQQEEIYLIDGSTYIYRAYHTTGGLTSSTGFPTGAVFGFTNMLMRTLREKEPKHIAVVFDSRGPTFRHEKFAEYKANRPPMPDDLSIQIPKIHEIVEAFQLTSLAVQGYEADDIIATLTVQAKKKGYRVVIVSGDKDLMQLIDENVSMWDPQSDKVYDPVTVQKKFGVGPENIVDFLGLMGDSSDNVPGVPGVGQKTAARLLEQYGSIEGIYSNIDDVSGKKLKENLVNNQDQAYMSRELVRLDHETPLDKKVDDLAISEPDSSKVRVLFEELEFQRFLQELPSEKSLDFSGYHTITKKSELDKWLSDMKKAGRFAVDLETTSEYPVLADLVGISLCCEEGKACYIPVSHEIGDQLPKDEVLKLLAPLLEDEKLAKIGQNIKYDLIVFRKEDVDIRNISCDTMLASYLLDPGRRSHSLDSLSQIFLKHKMIPIKDLIGTGKSQVPFSKVAIGEASDYSCEDADVTFRIANVLCPKVEEEGLGELFREVELPLIPILADMEITGVRIDIDYLNKLSDEFGRDLENMEEEIYKSAGESFNINSPKQLGDILFNKIGLKPIKKTKTGPSTSLDVLEALAVEHDLPRLVLDYRSIFKLKSTYVDALTGLVNPATGRIHTSYNQAVAATGRLSSSDPNLQNIPVRSSEGRKIRKAFIPDEDHVFLSADYSQIELRIMAHLSGDKRLREAFAGGEDIHSSTAASVFGCSPAHVTPDMRRKAKAINFGIMYGMGPFRLAQQLGVGLKMARQYLDDYYSMYSGVKEYMDKVPQKAAKEGLVTTILGRKRYLPDLNSPNKIAQQAAQRVAINTTMQGSAADLMKLAMIRVYNELESSNMPARMILQVHDELIVEVRQDVAEGATALVKKEMEHVYDMAVPLIVDTATGKNWDEAH